MSPHYSIPTVDTIIASFPISSIKKIDGQPNRDQLLNLDQRLCQNAVSVTTSLGGGGHGHLALCLDAVDYRNQTGEIFLPRTILENVLHQHRNNTQTTNSDNNLMIGRRLISSSTPATTFTRPSKNS